MIKRRKIDWGNVSEKIKNSEQKKKYDQEEWKEHIYTPKLGDDETFEGIIRFLPRPEGDGDGIPYVKLMNHGWQDKGGWFIENCPTTLGEPCPVCKENSIVWKSGNEKLASKRSRKTSFYANILVIKDTTNKENEGKVFIFRYGKKIHEKVHSAMLPSANSVDEPVQVFDYDEGQNFKLKIKMTGTGHERYKNYDASTFVGLNTKVGTDEEIAELETKLHALDTIVDPAKFKTGEQLMKRFEVVTGKSEAMKMTESKIEDEEDDGSFSIVDDSSTDASDEFFSSLRDDD